MAAAHVLLYVKLPAPRTMRFAALNVAGVGLFFGWSTVLLLLALGVVLWLSVLPVVLVRRARPERTASWLGWLSVAMVVGSFIAYKLHFDGRLISGSASEHPEKIDALYNVLRALSFSYVFLRSIDFVRSVVWSSSRLLDPLSLTGYLGPFHMLIAGPICPYADHVQLDETPRPEPTFSHALRCVNIVITGLFFKIVVAQAMKLFLFGVDGVMATGSWIDTAYLTAYLFFDFAGYSLIALGIGRLLHVPTPRNFDRPFLAMSVTDFWQRWHMSLGVFVRNNVFFPLQLLLGRRIRRRALATYASFFPLAVAFVFVAMWHRLTIPFLIWGLAMATILVVEKLVRDRCMAASWTRLPVARLGMRTFGPVYTIGVIITSLHYVAQEIFVG